MAPLTADRAAPRDTTSRNRIRRRSTTFGGRKAESGRQWKRPLPEPGCDILQIAVASDDRGPTAWDDRAGRYLPASVITVGQFRRTVASLRGGAGAGLPSGPAGAGPRPRPGLCGSRGGAGLPGRDPACGIAKNISPARERPNRLAPAAWLGPRTTNRPHHLIYA